MVRRRRNEHHAGHRVAELGDEGGDLGAGQLAAFAGLRALGHLDLDFLGGREVGGSDAEAAGGDLLDGGVGIVAVGADVETIRIFAAFAGVGLAADAVHRDGEGLVHLGRERAEGHAGGGEPLADVLDGFDLFKGDGGLGAEADLEKVFDGEGLVFVGVELPFLVALEGAGANELVHRRDDLRIPTVVFAFALLVDAVITLVAEGDGSLGRGGRERLRVTAQGLFGDLGVVDAADGRGGAGEALLDDLFGDAEGFEHLRAAVAGERGDAHLGHDLEEAGVDGGLVVDAGLLGGDGLGGLAGSGEVGDDLEREVGVDGIDTEPEETGEVVDVASLAAFGDEVALEAQAGADELLVDGTGG